MLIKTKFVKVISRLFLLKVTLLAAVGAAAQTEGSIWTVDAIKTNEGQQSGYLQFVEQNWAKARQTLKEKDKIKTYRVLAVAPEKTQSWDVMLLTEYADRATFENREEIFAEVFKTQKTVLINGKSGRDMSKIINLDLGYEQPISSERASEAIDKTETEAVKSPLENYLKGHATGDGAFIRRAFHADARITAVRDGKLLNLSVAEFAERFGGKPADDEAKRQRRIESIDVAGNSAVGKIILDYPSVKFVDYMTLLKIDGEWKIINKSFYAEPRTPPAK